MEYECNECNLKLDNIYKECPSCGAFINFPNVLAVIHDDSEEKLEERYLKFSNSDNKHFKNKVNDESYVVMNVDLDFLYSFVCHDEQYKTYYNQVKDKDRTRMSFNHERKRSIVDTSLFVSYKDNIIFAALSLEKSNGLVSYGNYSIFLKNKSVKNRTTFLEENSYNFAEKYSTELVLNGVPKGYRALWEHRAMLSIAKLGQDINSQTKEESFPDILLYSDGDRSKDEYIEAHIYGPISISSVNFIKQTKSNTNSKNKKDDLAKIEQIKATLSNKKIKWVSNE